MERVESDPSQTAPVRFEAWTPAAVLSLFQQSLPPSKRTPFVVSGILRHHARKEYHGWFYDQLEEPAGGARLTVRLPSAIRARCANGEAVQFRGYLEPQLKGETGTLQLTFVVGELLAQSVPALDPREARRLEVLRARLERPVRSPDSALRARLARGERPVIALVIGAVSVVGEDLHRALGAAAASYSIVEVRANMLSAAGLIEALRAAADTAGVDVIAVARGGGTGLEVFDDPGLAGAALALEVPLIVAIGHAVDVPLLARVADASVDTPSALGAHWRALVDEAARGEDGALETARLRVSLPLLARIGALERRVLRLNVAVLAALALGVVVGALTAHFLRR
jgi:hypothetical protein